ncbi:hypothetical protein CLV62_1433 [Dysgonomonas alginatilytica]|uniref:Uncharacterized protein n=1 Tax=Dysgonomonas alginatilytica TaxID=1605892 RepID=A0A2V3PKL3_9BACT|nr:hypothetical protein [Dysgonomonas alginatilytica]PXV58823.1 hypothetical protein CLV62_1433 [Dysgonomonas alginatilytica]
MKKTILLFVVLLSANMGFSQVGINTKYPQGVFHIDPLGNNNKSGVPTVAEMADDVIVDSNGNIGLGVISTKAKVDIKTSGTATNPVSGFILNDGNQATTKVLISDANGNATWKYPKQQGAVFGTFGTTTGVLVSNDWSLTGTYSGQTLVARPSNGNIRTGAQIILPTGRWWVKVSLYIAALVNGSTGEQVWVRTTLADATSNLGPSADLESSFTLASGLIWKNPGGVVVGSFLLNNKTASAKTYTLLVGGIDNTVPSTVTNTVFRTGMSGSSENTFIAFRISQ